MALPKIHHLIRYFFILGVLTFVGYAKSWYDDAFLALIGPSLYLAYGFKNFLSGYLPLPSSYALNYYVFLLPLTLIYFSFLGFQLKQLWNERGKIKFVSLFALIVFVVYVHFAAWKYMNSFLASVA